ncbi:hypothetical protein GEV33_000349 [Tenebrio molitor]|uniref:TRASH domain-containing protein n=1 Tax=Tenebrio molitor TaxID=7067 RepID=A0A8J6LHK1_TENMO|nr:hypothetical protein GEV33_000349 [Tenebrio molitor]
MDTETQADVKDETQDNIKEPVSLNTSSKYESGESLNTSTEIDQVLLDSIMDTSDQILEDTENSDLKDESSGNHDGTRENTERTNVQSGDSPKESIERESDKLDTIICDKLEESNNEKSEDSDLTPSVFKQIECINEKVDVEEGGDKLEDKLQKKDDLEDDNTMKDLITDSSGENVCLEENPLSEVQVENTAESDHITGNDDTSQDEFSKKNLDESEKDKEEQPTNSIEYVELVDETEDDENQRQEFVSVNTDKDDNENEDKVVLDNEVQSTSNSIENMEVNNDNEDDDNQRENPLFVRVNLDKEDNDKEGSSKEDLLEEDPIASDGFINENQEGADEELCIIPDTERVISQEEKEAAFSIPPLRDLTEASSSVDTSEDGTSSIQPSASDLPSSSNKFIVSKCNIEEFKTCLLCVLKRKVKYTVSKGDTLQHICSDNCLDTFKVLNANNYLLNWDGEIRVKDLTCNKETPKPSYERKCVVCKKKTDDEENNLTWEIMDFCNEFCLSKYQKEIGSVCASCSAEVRPNSLGKYCVRFGNDIRQFCSSHCLEEYKKGLKVCSYCQQDMSSESDGFLAPKSPITLNNTDESSYPVPAGEPKKNRKFALTESQCPKPVSPPLPVISSVQSLASKNGNFTNTQPNTAARNSRSKTNSAPQHILNSNVEPQVKVKHHIIIKSNPAPDQRNVATMCKLKQHHKSTTMKPIMFEKGIQTDEREAQKILIPVPIPVYIPSPLPMYSVPAPYPLPFPLPIPVPIFIPTTRNSAKGIMKEIKKIQVKIPTDPYEAELLMMAEMVAGDKKEENTDSESDVDDAGAGDEGTFSPEPVDASNTFGDDMLQMALKMATELEEPAVDLEGALTANTITAPQGGENANEESVDDPQPMLHLTERQSFRGRKRGSRGGKQGSGTKRRRMSQPVELPVMPPQPVAPPEPAEKPDAHLCLKYTFGVNAWKQWVTTKNAELEKSSKFAKPFKTEILQLTADELNYSLCLFVKEVRKPNGAEYAPDTIFYLCLGIQQYLFENNRIDNIFCDPYYEQFTDSLDEVARKFSVLYNDSHYIVTRVEEEHLWESKQLGAHSPHVLLSTLMFFNTKHFNLTTVQEHMQLSFSHIMKHWKRNPNQAGVARVPGSRNVLLRFYPPQTAMQNNTRKKKVYEQQENDENPLRCPVKLYEFYLSKCPESVKTRNDVFYLQPERSCVPDSPVWYSTTALPQEALEKMLHRVKMVKEINVALLTS